MEGKLEVDVHQALLKIVGIAELHDAMIMAIMYSNRRCI